MENPWNSWENDENELEMRGKLRKVVPFAGGKLVGKWVKKHT